MGNKIKDPILDMLHEHHVVITSEARDQHVGDCIFCGKEGHFFMHQTKGLWDCKSCGSSGNVAKFLYQIAMAYHKQLINSSNADKLKKLSIDRGLPISAFKPWYVGWDSLGKRYTIPVIAGDDSCSDIRLYKLKMKTRASSGCKAGLFNMHKITPLKPVYVCEGEWDGMALEWLLSKLKVDAVVVAVPGAAIFKKEWLPAFRGCKVQLLYDNDAAGDDAEIRARQMLSGTAKSIKFLRWLTALPSGFDVRDWIKRGVEVKKLTGCWTNLRKLFFDVPRTENPEAPSLEETAIAVQEGEAREVDLEEELAYYRKWMHLPDKYILDIMFGTILANINMSGDPVWMFLIAPPGGSKSELLMSLMRCQDIVCLTSLTPHSLISGYSWGANGKDPSLLPQLDGKVMVLKDFTAITSMHFSARDEIFGILRDAYDGKTEKQFGTGVRREYKSKFGILAGTTPVIDTFSTIHQSLGERFLKYRIKIDSQETEEKKIMQAISNINNETAMRSELQEAALRILSRKAPAILPVFSKEYLKKVSALAQFCARMRGVVIRDAYTQQVLYKPSSEVGTRLAKQLMKLGIGVGILRGVKELAAHEYKCVSRVALHTCSDRLVSVVKAIYRSAKEDSVEQLLTKEISEYSRLPSATVFRLLEDLYLLGIVSRIGEGSKYLWGLEKGILKLLDESMILE